MAIEIIREYYEHDGACDAKTWGPTNARGLKRCLDCSGIFNEHGIGVAVTDKRFD